MDPLTLGLGIVGLGMSIFGGAKQSEVSHQQAQVSQDEAHQEQGINDAKQQAMELHGRRQQLEIIRNNQRARAMAENASVNQGAQFGSGLQGGLAQINDQSLFNLTGVNTALETGRTIAGYNQNITNDKIKMAGLGADAATAQGWTSLGGSVMKSGPLIGALGKGFGFGSSNSNLSLSNTGGLY